MFDLIERGHNSAVTSTITLLELLVQPYRDQKEELAQKIFALASTYPKLEWVPVIMDLADRGPICVLAIALARRMRFKWLWPSAARPRAFMEMIEAYSV